MEETARGLGGEIRRLRANADLTLDELAKQVGCRARYLEDIEAGRVEPSDEFLHTLADRLGGAGGNYELLKRVKLQEADALEEAIEISHESSFLPYLLENDVFKWALIASGFIVYLVISNPLSINIGLPWQFLLAANSSVVVILGVWWSIHHPAVTNTKQKIAACVGWLLFVGAVNGILLIAMIGFQAEWPRDLGSSPVMAGIGTGYLILALAVWTLRSLIALGVAAFVWALDTILLVWSVCLGDQHISSAHLSGLLVHAVALWSMVQGIRAVRGQTAGAMRQARP